MKSKGKSLIIAFNQAMNYVNALKPEEKPRLIMCSDFDKILVHNLEKNFTYKEFRLSQLKDHIRIFGLLAGFKNKTDETVEIEVNTQASYKIAKIHDSLKEKGYLGHDLELFMVRIVFCLFAEDTGIFEKESFEKYIESSKIDGSDLSSKLLSLFSILDTPVDKRPKGLPDNLEKFRYINGSIFSDKLPLASFDQKMRSLLLQCSKDFNWSKISPAIFGAMFQGVMDEISRRKLGAHYTSRENIIKVLKPLFLQDLYSEFEKSKSTKKELEDFQKKLSKLNFLDPACGSGNFLIVAYEELRRLEFEVLKLLYDHKDNMFLDVVSMVKPEQFNGIEIEDFPAQIANLSMVLIKHLLDQEISNYFGSNSIDFPIKKSAKIIVGDSLEIEWSDLVPYENLDYIIGNPPFIGSSRMSKTQKNQIRKIYLDNNGKSLKNSGLNDYVSGWFYKASKIMSEHKTRACFVATNSITQGEQTQSVW
jgi:type I restriction-modification system DNA methylase subunit